MAAAAADDRVAWLQQHICNALAADEQAFSSMLHDGPSAALLQSFLDTGSLIMCDRLTMVLKRGAVVRTTGLPRRASAELSVQQSACHNIAKAVQMNMCLPAERSEHSVMRLVSGLPAL